VAYTYDTDYAASLTTLAPFVTQNNRLLRYTVSRMIASTLTRVRTVFLPRRLTGEDAHPTRSNITVKDEFVSGWSAGPSGDCRRRIRLSPIFHADRCPRPESRRHDHGWDAGHLTTCDRRGFDARRISNPRAIRAVA
jgi:hypothetical protein